MGKNVGLLFSQILLEKFGAPQKLMSMGGTQTDKMSGVTVTQNARVKVTWKQQQHQQLHLIWHIWYQLNCQKEMDVALELIQVLAKCFLPFQCFFNPFKVLKAFFETR